MREEWESTLIEEGGEKSVLVAGNRGRSRCAGMLRKREGIPGLEFGIYWRLIQWLEFVERGIWRRGMEKVTGHKSKNENS